MLAAAYVLGILVDRIADTTLRAVEHVAPGPVADKPAGVARMRMTVLREGGGISSFVDYQRSRLRVARATVVNLVIAIPVVVAFLIVRTDADAPTIAGAGLALAFAIVVGYVAFRGIEFAYVARLGDAYGLIRELPKIDRAAAVPWRRRDGRLELLLVKTSGGDRWTFPKGHVEKTEHETLPQAARREAREEAGVAGRIDGKRLAVFRYPANSRSDREQDLRVAAYLLNVSKEGLDGEPKRSPTWFSPEDARRALAEGGREPEYAEDLGKVVGKALEQLGGY